MNHSGSEVVLTTNYRSTNQIIEFLNHIRPYSYLPPMTGIGRDGDKPTIIVDNIENILNNILMEIKKGDYNLEDIAIIGPVKKANYKNNFYVNIGLQLIANFLSKNKIKYNQHYKLDDVIDTMEYNKVKGCVNLITSHGSKGLEFKKTLVINYHHSTFGIIPTEEDYKRFRYLWYVSLSRATDKLIVYVDSNKNIFPDIINVPNNLYNLYGVMDFYTGDYNKDFKPQYYEVTKILNDNNYFNDNTFYEFENSNSYQVVTEKLYDVNYCDIYEHQLFSSLYGKYIEELFTFYYYKNSNNIEKYITSKKNKIDNTIVVKKEDFHIYSKLEKKGIIIGDTIYNVSNLLECRDKLSSIEYSFIEECYKKTMKDSVTVIKESSLYYLDSKYILNLYDNLLISSDVEKTLFDIILYFYQIEVEALYMMEKDFTLHLLSIEKYFPLLNKLAQDNIKNDFEFQYYTSHNHYNLIGIADIVSDIVIELKFVKSIDIKHIIQTLLYTNNIKTFFPKKQTSFQIWNLYDGTINTITFNNISAWNLNLFIVKTLGITMHNNIFIFDLETNTTVEHLMLTTNMEIIERYVHEYNFGSCVSKGLIKPTSILKPSITTITGITEQMLVKADKDITIFKKELDTIMTWCYKPIFIAHNGKRFDFKILFEQNLLQQNKVRLIDTCYDLRLFIPELKSMNLGNIYKHVMNKEIKNAHRAKADTKMIVEVINKLNITPNMLITMCQ